MQKVRMGRNLKRASQKAKELGYVNLRDLDENGTAEHKALVKNAYNNNEGKNDGNN